jgi:hypothetical protein
MWPPGSSGSLPLPNILPEYHAYHVALAWKGQNSKYGYY